MNPVVPQDDSWRQLAVCREDPSPFFGPDQERPGPAQDKRLAAALEMCERCPVAAECLGHALLNFEREGVWGGLTWKQRQRVAKRWKWRHCLRCDRVFQRTEPGLTICGNCDPEPAARPPVTQLERPVVDPRIIRATDAFDLEMIDGWTTYGNEYAR